MAEEDDPLSPSDLQCSYCGKWIYGDSPRCPKCGNYTDGLGKFGGTEYAQDSRAGRKIPRVYLIAGWLVILAFLLPVLLAIYSYFNR